MFAKAFAVATVPAEDIKRAVKFYTEVLGLKKIEIPLEDSALFEAGKGSQIFMYQRARTKAEHTAVTFMTDDIEGIVKELTAKGVKFNQYEMGPIKTNAMGIADVGDTKSAWLTDPEGNILAIVSQ